jgi:hypothetical protein
MMPTDFQLKEKNLILRNFIVSDTTAWQLRGINLKALIITST